MRNSLLGTRLVLLSMGLILASPLVSCSAEGSAVSSGGTQDVAAGGDAPTEAQEATWELPTDGLVLTVPQANFLFYAEEVAVGRCMQDLGHSYEVPLLAEGDFEVDGLASGRNIYLFNADIARSRGYQQPDTLPAGFDSRANEALLSSPEAAAEAAQCLESIRESFAILDALDLSNEMNGWIGVDAENPPPWESDDVSAAAERWRDCMAPMGISDLPEFPMDKAGIPLMPTAGMRAGLSEQEALSAEPPPSFMPIALADAGCRESSGVTRAMYLEMWNEETRRLRDVPTLADDLVRARALYDEVRQQAREIVAQSAGRPQQ